MENLATKAKSAGDLAELSVALSRQMALYGVRNPLVLIGDSTSRAAIDEFSRVAGLPVTAVDSFSLAGDDLGAGLAVRFPEVAEWKRHDGVVCLDSEPAAYLNGVQFCHDHGLALPVLTDFDAMPGQFCQTVVTDGEAGATEMFIWNYFTKYYRVKDPLQMLWRVVWDNGVTTRGTMVLGANANVMLRAKDLGVPRAGETGTVVYEVHHPAFARVPNRRFRSYIDVVAATSVVCHHGDEISPKRADKGEWFDSHAALLGDSHDIVVGVRKDVTEPDALTLVLTLQDPDGGNSRDLTLDLGDSELQRFVSVRQAFGVTGADKPARVIARVRGRGYRMAWIESYSGKDGTPRFIANHGSSNDPDMAPLLVPGAAVGAPDPVLFERFAKLRERGVLTLPYPLPVLPRSSNLRYSFSAQKFLPLLDYVEIAAFDADGKLVGVEKVALPADLGYVGVEQTPFADALAERGGLLLICPPYADKGMVAYQNCREDLWIKVEDTNSGDADITEFQMHNRNLRGYTVPIGFGQAANQIKARSELLIRYRVDAPYQTHFFLINASPELSFDRPARVELEYNLPDGRSASTWVDIKPQTVLTLDAAEAMPECLRGRADFGWLRVNSDTAALSAYCTVTDPATGAVGLQHLLGA